MLFFASILASNALGAPVAALGVLIYLAWINGLLLAFNVAPTEQRQQR